MLTREINLLPPAITTARTARIYLGRLGRLLRFTLFLGALFLAVLAVIYGVVWRTQALVVAQSNQAADHSRAVLEQVQKVNGQLAGIAAWQADHQSWTPDLPALLQTLPADLTLTSMGADTQQQRLEVRGIFTRRESLVAWQRQLEQLSWVKQVESPLSNFATGSEARFSLIIWRQP